MLSRRRRSDSWPPSDRPPKDADDGDEDVSGAHSRAGVDAAAGVAAAAAAGWAEPGAGGE